MDLGVFLAASFGYGGVALGVPRGKARLASREQTASHQAPMWLLCLVMHVRHNVLLARVLRLLQMRLRLIDSLSPLPLSPKCARQVLGT